MDTNTLYMEHYVDLHNYISDNIYELDENCIFENGIGDLLKKTVEGGQNAVKWLCTTIQKLWHFITKWFTGTQRKARQVKLRDLMSGSKKKEIAKQNLDNISEAISEEYKKDKKYHLLDLKDKDFDAIAEEILKYCRDKDSILDFYLDEEEDFEKLHKIVKILDKLSDRLVHRTDKNETNEKAIKNINEIHIWLIDRYLKTKNYKGFRKFIMDLLLNTFDTIYMKGANSFITFVSKMKKIKPTEINDDIIDAIKIEINNSDNMNSKENTIKYIDLLKNIKTIQKFFIHYIKMLDLLIASINNVLNIDDAEIVDEKKEA